MTTYEKSTLNEQRKEYWAGRSSSNGLGSGDGFQRHVSHGIHPGNEAATILEFFAGLRGTLAVTFEEGTWAAWLYDPLKPHVVKLVVCNPRKNALLKHGNKLAPNYPAEPGAAEVLRGVIGVLAAPDGLVRTGKAGDDGIGGLHRFVVSSESGS